VGETRGPSEKKVSEWEAGLDSARRKTRRVTHLKCGTTSCADPRMAYRIVI
jgi:hypothetical protein